MPSEETTHLVFEVRYTRELRTNRWKARTHERPMIRGWQAGGMMGGAWWAAQREGEKNFAAIYVSVDRDPRFFRLSPEYDEAWRGMVETANEIADREFKTRYPDAEIEPREEC